MNQLNLKGFLNGDVITVEVEPHLEPKRYLRFTNQISKRKFRPELITERDYLEWHLKKRILRNADKAWSKKSEFEFFGLSSLTKIRKPKECHENCYAMLTVKNQKAVIILWYERKKYQVSVEMTSTNPIFYAEIPLK